VIVLAEPVQVVAALARLVSYAYTPPPRATMARRAVEEWLRFKGFLKSGSQRWLMRDARRELITTAVAQAVELLLDDEIEDVDPFRAVVVFAVAAASDVTIAEILRAIQASGRGDEFTRRYAFPHA
jgi:hypothetical protein